MMRSNLMIFTFSPGIRGLVQAAARLPASVPTRVDVHAQREAPQMPRAVRPRESHQSGQLIIGAIRQVSINY